MLYMSHKLTEEEKFYNRQTIKTINSRTSGNDKKKPCSFTTPLRVKRGEDQIDHKSFDRITQNEKFIANQEKEIKIKSEKLE